MGAFVEEASDYRQSVMKERILAPDAHGRKRLGPEIADFENEGNLAEEGGPPPSEADEQLRRGRDDHIRARKS
jgi:hypothetical protein